MNNKLTIGITGASGHIGSHLAGYLVEKGFTVVSLVRNPDAADLSSRKYDLTGNIPDDLLNGIDILIHCAYVTKQQHTDAARINREGSEKLFSAAREKGIRKIIFFSTVTADINARSGYAKSKYEIEQLLDSERDFVARCSMVIGTGGLFQRMMEYGTSHTIIPLVSAGNQVVQVIAIDDVARLIEQVITRDLTGTGVLANEEAYTYKQIFRLIAKVNYKKIIFVPVPANVLKSIVKISRFLRLPVGATEENIQGIQTLRRQEPLLILPSFISLEKKLRTYETGIYRS